MAAPITVAILFDHTAADELSELESLMSVLKSALIGEFVAMVAIGMQLARMTRNASG
jgi:hypothetical protein